MNAVFLRACVCVSLVLGSRKKEEMGRWGKLRREKLHDCIFDHIFLLW